MVGRRLVQLHVCHVLCQHVCHLIDTAHDLVVVDVGGVLCPLDPGINPCNLDGQPSIAGANPLVQFGPQFANLIS